MGDTLTETATDTEYTITYTATTTGEGTVTLTIASGVVTDTHGNSNTQLISDLATYDAARPSALTMALSADTGPLDTDGITASGTINVIGLEVGGTFEYQAKNVGDLWGSDWTLGSGTTFNSATNTTREYRVRQTDSNGNVGTESAGVIITHDNLQPSVTTFSLADTTLGVNATTSINIVFSENMYGFTASDIGVTGNGATSSFSGANGSSTYAMVYTAPAVGAGTVSFGVQGCLLYTSPSPRDRTRSRMPSSA